MNLRGIFTMYKIKTGKKVLIKAAAMILALAVTLTLGCGFATEVMAADGHSYNTVESILGDAVAYGIVANKYSQNGDTQTNAAVKEWTGGAGIAQFDLTFAKNINIMVSNLKETLKFGRVNSATSGLEVNVYVGSGIENIKDNEGDFANPSFTYNKKTVDAASIDTYIEKMITNVKSVSSDIVSSTKDITLALDEYDQNCYYVDASSVSKDVVIVEIPSNVMDSYNNLQSALGNGQLWLKKKSNQMVIFNYSGSSEIIINGMYVNVTDRGSDFNGEFNQSRTAKRLPADSGIGLTDFIKTDGSTQANSDKNKALDKYVANKVAFNFANSSASIKEIAGIFLLPASGARLNVTNTSSGFVVCNGEVYTNSEWHYLYAASNGSPKSVTPPDFSGGGKETPKDPKDIELIKVFKDEKGTSVAAPTDMPKFTLYSDAGCTARVAEKAVAKDGSQYTIKFTKADGIKSQNTYYLMETYAPVGFKKSTDVYECKIDENGAVTYKVMGSAAAYSATLPTCNNIESKEAEAGDVKLIKTFVNEKGDAIDAPTDLPRFALYSDINCTSRVGAEKTVDYNGVNYTVTFTKNDGIKCGKSYYLKETYIPEGFAENSDVFEFKIDANGNVTYKHTALAGEFTSAVPKCQNVKKTEEVKEDKEELDDKDGTDTPNKKKKHDTSSKKKKTGSTTNEQSDSKNTVDTSAVPKTGEANVILIYLSVMAFCLFAGATTLIVAKKIK